MASAGNKKMSPATIAVLFIAMLASAEAIQVQRNVQAQRMLMGMGAPAPGVDGQQDEQQGSEGAGPKKYGTSEISQLDAQVRSILFHQDHAAANPGTRSFKKLKTEIENFGLMMEQMAKFDGVADDINQAKLEEFKGHLKKAGASSFMKFASGALRFMKSATFKKFRGEEAKMASKGVDEVKEALYHGGCMAVKLDSRTGAVTVAGGDGKVDVEGLKKCLHAARPTAEEEDQTAKTLVINPAPEPGKTGVVMRSDNAAAKMAKELSKDAEEAANAPGSVAQMVKLIEQGKLGSAAAKKVGAKLGGVDVDEKPLKEDAPVPLTKPKPNAAAAAAPVPLKEDAPIKNIPTVPGSGRKLERSKSFATRRAEKKQKDLAGLFIETMQLEAQQSGNEEDMALWSGAGDMRIWFWAGVLFSAVIAVVVIVWLIKLIVTLLIIFAVCFGVAFLYFQMKDNFGLRRRLLASSSSSAPLLLEAPSEFGKRVM